jgi:hypothetical protein
LRATRAIDNCQEDTGYPQAVHRKAKDRAAVKSSFRIDKEGCDQQERRNHNQDRGYALSAVEGLTVRQGKIGDGCDQKEQMTRTKDQPRDAI